jgi:uncharacterized protein (DUF58 family)
MSIDLLDALSVLKRRHRVLLLAVSDPLVHQWASAPIESQAQTYRRRAALYFESARHGLIDELNGLGIDALDLPAQSLTASTLNQYLRIRAAGIV